jgi:pimeloyl-ACP methyl ester carboxylesterase/nucleotide-binding universal stress UspA family protein
MLFSLTFALSRTLVAGRRPRRRPLTAAGLADAVVLIVLSSFVVRLWFPARSGQVGDLHLWQWPQCVGLLALGLAAARSGWLGHVPDRVNRTCGLVTLTVLGLLPVLALATGIRDVSREAAPYLGGWHWESLALAVMDAVLVVAGSVWLVGLAERRLRAGGPHAVHWGRSAFAAFVIQGPVLMAVASAGRLLDAPAEVKAPLVAALSITLCFWIGGHLTSLVGVTRAAVPRRGAGAVARAFARTMTGPGTGESRTADLGVPVHYVDFGGNPDGPTVVLVHGLGGSHLNWDLLAPELTRNGRVLALDLPGFGMSPPRRRPATMRRNVAVLTRFVREVAGPPVVLVGNSMGGLVSVLLTAREPHLVRGLVLLDPALPAPSRVLRSPQAAAALLLHALPGVGERLRRNRRRRIGARATVRETLRLCGSTRRAARSAGRKVRRARRAPERRRRHRPGLPVRVPVTRLDAGPRPPVPGGDVVHPGACAARSRRRGPAGPGHRGPRHRPGPPGLAVRRAARSGAPPAAPGPPRARATRPGVGRMPTGPDGPVGIRRPAVGAEDPPAPPPRARGQGLATSRASCSGPTGTRHPGLPVPRMQPDNLDPSSNPILVAYDGSRSARTAASWAASEAARIGRPLWLAHVMRWPLHELDGLRLPTAIHDVGHARQSAADSVGAAVAWCRRLAPGVEVRGVALTGGVVDLLAKLAEEASMLVLGASGQTASPQVLLGSSAAELTRRVAVPVAVIRDVPADDRTRGVVIGVDGSPASTRAVHFGFDIAARCGLGVVAVHAWSDLPLEALGLRAHVDGERGGEDARALLEEQLSGAREQYPDVQVEKVVTLDRPARALLDSATGAALLVVGRHGRAGGVDAPLGSVCHAVLHYAPCPVLLAG